MLEVIKIQNRSQIAQIFAQYNPRQQSWLVSDLRTKLELQQKILERDGQYVDEAVLRASDLWKILLKRLEPRLRLVSDHFARSLLRSIMDEHVEILGVNSSAEDSLFSYIDQMAPIIFHPDGTRRLDEWFDSHPEAKNRWGEWYLRARFCVVKLIEEHRVITADWITSYLQTFTELEQVWETPLVVDLSSEISRVEAEILRVLSRSVDILILEPAPGWRDEFSYLLRPYEDLRGQAKQVRVAEGMALMKKQVEVLRFSGMLAETKYAVGKVREWLEAGIAMENIAVIAPDIEMYWPVLQAFLQEEGVAYQKDITHKVQSLPSVTRWMSMLRAKSGKLSTSDIEISFFERQESHGLRYEEFKALFKSLYVSDDLSRNQLIHRIYYEQMDLSGFVSRDEFVGKALTFWNTHETDVVQVILRELLQNALVQTKLNWKEWLSYLETIVASKEFTLEKGQPSGIMVTKLMSASSPKALYRIFLGLSDEALKSRVKTQLMGQDYFDLAKDMGFYLENPDQSDLAFELKHLAEADSKMDLYCFGGADFSGSLQSPSTFWMEAQRQSPSSVSVETLTLPLETRWDQLQHAPDLRGQRPWLVGRKALLEDHLLRDLGKKEALPLKLGQAPRISVSSLESYLDCPFVFAAQRYFRLQDHPDIDLDVDHRTRGQLAHALFEKLTVEPMRFDWSSEELDGVLESIKVEKKLLFADPRLWIPLKKKHVQVGLRFLQFEKKWRDEFRKTKTLAREARFEFYFDHNTGAFSQVPLENSYRISGQIDRIDGDDEGHLLVIDYKSSGGGISAHSSWLKNHQLQLLFYAWVIEKSLVKDVQGEVIGLFYYLFKTFERKGFRIDELAGSLYPPLKRKDKNATAEAKEAYLAELSQLVTDTLRRISQGDVAAKPKDPAECKSCDWRRLCRAPHLN